MMGESDKHWKVGDLVSKPPRKGPYVVVGKIEIKGEEFWLLKLFSPYSAYISKNTPLARSMELEAYKHPYPEEKKLLEEGIKRAITAHELIGKMGE